jgi:hypothetical protein
MLLKNRRRSCFPQGLKLSPLCSFVDIVGRVPFTDGIERDVFVNADGRQHVIGYDGEPVYGVWLPPADEPLIVSGECRATTPSLPR